MTFPGLRCPLASWLAGIALPLLVMEPVAFGASSTMSVPVPLSVTPAGGSDGEDSIKGKIKATVYPTSGGSYAKVLIAIYNDVQGPEVWDYTGARYGARDVFASRSADGGLTWTTPVNLSSTATLSSIAADGDGIIGTPPVDYYGDSEKAFADVKGKNVVVSWVDRYCPGGGQRTVRYAESAALEVPYACLYVVRSTDGGVSWSTPQQLTTGERDAKQDSGKGCDNGFALVWQEDPRGLQPGEGEGPGDGGSGAKVSGGTDIWYSALSKAEFSSGAPFPQPRRITDNVTGLDLEGLETGPSGASRPNIALVGTTAAVAYEESKGGELVLGKYVRFHTFSAFDESMPDPTGGQGYILSKPDENARRARLVPQPQPLLGTSALRLFVFWRQGYSNQGGPADVVGRLGFVDPLDPSSTGLRPEDFYPSVDPGCTSPTFAAANAPGVNLTSSLGLAAGTSDDSLENARAHRAVVRGDFIAFGYTYAGDGALADATVLDNYDFLVRRSFDGGMSWGAPRNLSRIGNLRVNVAEPRLMTTPFSPDPGDMQDPNVLTAAWSTQFKDIAAGELIPLDSFVSSSGDRGASWTPIEVLAGGANAQGELQAACTPDGKVLFAVWQEQLPDGAIDTMFRRSELPSWEIFADGFEGGDLSSWTKATAL